MLTLTAIREKKDEIIERLKIKNFEASEKLNYIIEKDDLRRSILTERENKQNELNNLSKSISNLYKEGKKEEADTIKEKGVELKNEVKSLYIKLSETYNDLQRALFEIPNIPHESVPQGNGAEDNFKEEEGGQIPELFKEALPHWELAKKYDIIDFELGNKITGSGFPVYKGRGAKLQRALISFFLDENEKAGYQEYQPPLVVNKDSAFGTGQLPDKDGQMYSFRDESTNNDFYLIPTAEVPVTNVFRDIILKEKDLPVKCTAYTPCFRREAGSYGKDVRGLNRLHQFDKVEIVQIQHPDKSYESLNEMVHHVENLIVKLELPYRIMKLCGGDMSFTSALTYDFEVFSAAQDKWLEVSSVSNFESYQANRLKLRYRDMKTKKPLLAHTLNGSALALPRIVAALLENNQTRDGILIPKVLQTYTGFSKID